MTVVLEAIAAGAALIALVAMSRILFGGRRPVTTTRVRAAIIGMCIALMALILLAARERPERSRIEPDIVIGPEPPGAYLQLRK